MEQRVSVWKANLNNGLILGLTGIVYTLLIWIMDLTFNRVQGYIFIVVLIILLYYLVKSYRDNFLNGYITYGQSVGAGVIICLYNSIISAIFIYILYVLIDPGLQAKQTAFTEELLIKRGTPEAVMESALSFAKKFQKPWALSLSSIFTGVFFGTIVSLIVGLFVKKEGNPLIDSPEN